jgi:hypothetical protein
MNSKEAKGNKHVKLKHNIVDRIMPLPTIFAGLSSSYDVTITPIV